MKNKKNENILKNTKTKNKTKNKDRYKIKAY